MSLSAGSVRTVSEFRYYFPNASRESPDDYLEVIPLDKYRAILIIAFSLLLVIGLSANGWVARVVITVLCQTRTEASRAVQIFILALCACDFFVLAFLCLLILDLWYGQWIVPSSFLCQSYLISESLSKFYAPFLLVALSGFCYFSVKRYRQNVAAFSFSRCGVRNCGATKGALAAVIVASLLSAVFMIPVYLYSDLHYLILYNESEVYGVVVKCAFQPPEYIMSMFTVYSFVCGYTIPACLFSLFYVGLLVYVHKRRRKSSSTTVKSLDYFSRIARTSLGLVLFYFVSWTPYWLMSVYQYFTPSDDYGEMSDATIVMSYFIHMLPYINCNAYPLLYTVMNRSIQHDYLRACERSRSLSRRRTINGSRISFPSSTIRKSSNCNSSRTETSSPGFATVSLNDTPWILRKASRFGKSTAITRNRSTVSASQFQAPVTKSQSGDAKENIEIDKQTSDIEMQLLPSEGTNTEKDHLLLTL